MSRALGIDLGAARIGVAVSDSERRMATPIETVARQGRDRSADHRRIAQLVEEWEAAVVVVGLPLSLDGGTGPAAQGVLDEVDQLRAVLPVPVETVDERFTTVSADRALREQGVKGKARTAVIDQAAAAVLLQSWLDQRPDRR